MAKDKFQKGDLQNSDSVDSKPAGSFELICIFFCAMGVSIGFTATLSCVSYLTAIFDDDDIFLYLCCCVYGPTLPVVLFQLNCDQRLDRRWGSSKTYYGRVVIAFLFAMCCVLYLPYSSGVNPAFEGHRSYSDLLFPVAIMGIQSSVLQGMFFQLVSFMQFNKKGAGAAAFTFGYQGSGFLSLVMTYACGGLGTDPSATHIDIFFALVAALQLVALSFFLWMAHKSVAYKNAIKRRDEEMKWLSFKKISGHKKKRGPDTLRRVFTVGKNLLSSPLLADYDERYFLQMVEVDRNDPNDTSANQRKSSLFSDYYNNTEEVIRDIEENSSHERDLFSGLLDIVENMEPASKRFVLSKIWPCVAGIFLVIFGSIFFMPFYAYIPGGSSLPQILFYTKIFSDTLSRPLTMIIPKPRSSHLYLFMTFLRLAIFLPIFFLYIYDLLGIQNDLFIIGMVSAYSLTSGLFGTFGYQLAPSLLEHSNSKLIAANQMNLSFNSACVMALVVSFTIIKTFKL